MTTSDAITLNNLSKRYGHSAKMALNKVSLSVGRGEVYGFLGANGAGKSTTIRTLLNFIQPTGGSATILGYDIARQSVDVKRHIGYLAGDVALYNAMTGQQLLAYMAELQPLKHQNYRNELARMFDAELNKPLDTLSKGNRQKIGIIQAFMHEPEVLILDEPTSGLDPLMQEAFYKLVRASCDGGASVFVSSHNFAEVGRMCDRVGFIREGKLVAERTLSDLISQAAHTFTLLFRDEAPVAELRHLARARITAHDEHNVTISLQGELTPLFALLAKHHVTRLEQQELNLEEEFLKFYGKAAG
jgi:ABC-2 type transport system ATP-binding protein